MSEPSISTTAGSGQLRTLATGCKPGRSAQRAALPQRSAQSRLTSTMISRDRPQTRRQRHDRAAPSHHREPLATGTPRPP